MVEPGGAVVALTARQGPVTVRVSAFEVPPPGAGVKAVMLSAPPAAMSPARMVAESWVGPTKVVARGLPFARTTEFPAKLEPETVRVKSVPPPATVLGDRLDSVGAGGGAVTLSESALEAQRPPTQAAGLVTCTGSVPWLANSPACPARASGVGED